jgi:hypothetical protein
MEEVTGSTAAQRPGHGQAGEMLPRADEVPRNRPLSNSRLNQSSARDATALRWRCFIRAVDVRLSSVLLHG